MDIVFGLCVDDQIYHLIVIRHVFNCLQCGCVSLCGEMSSRKRKGGSSSSSSSGSDISLKGIGIKRTVVPESVRRTELTVILNSLIEQDQVVLQDADDVLRLISLARKFDLWTQVYALSKNDVWAPLFLRDFGPVQFKDESMSAVKEARELLRTSDAWKEVERFMTAKLALNRTMPSIETGTQQFIQTQRDMGPDMSPRREVRRVDIPVATPVPRDQSTLYKAWYEYEQRLVKSQWRETTTKERVIKTPDGHRQFAIFTVKAISDIFFARIHVSANAIEFFILDDGLAQRTETSGSFTADARFELPDLWSDNQEIQMHAYGNRLVVVNLLTGQVIVIELEIGYKNPAQVSGNSQTIFNAVVVRRINQFTLKHPEAVAFGLNVRQDNMLTMYQSRMLVPHIEPIPGDELGSKRLVVGIYALGIESDNLDITQPREYDDQSQYYIGSFDRVNSVLKLMLNKRDAVVFAPRYSGFSMIRLDSPQDRAIDDRLDGESVISGPVFSKFTEKYKDVRGVIDVVDVGSVLCRGGIVALPIVVTAPGYDPREVWQHGKVQYVLYLSDDQKEVFVVFDELRSESKRILYVGYNLAEEERTPSYLFGNGYMFITVGNMGDQTNNYLTSESDDLQLIRYQDLLDNFGVIASGDTIGDDDNDDDDDSWLHKFTRDTRIVMGDQLVLLTGFKDPDYGEDARGYADEYLGGFDKFLGRDALVRDLDIDPDLTGDEREAAIEEQLQSYEDEAESELLRALDPSVTGLYLDFATDRLFIQTWFNSYGFSYIRDINHTFVSQLKNPTQPLRYGGVMDSTETERWYVRSRDFYTDGTSISRQLKKALRQSFAFGVAQLGGYLMHLENVFGWETLTDGVYSNGQYVFVELEFADTSRQRSGQYLRLVSGKLGGGGDSNNKAIDASLTTRHAVRIANKLKLKK